MKAGPKLKHGAWVVVGLFLLTITMAVTAHNLLHLPPVAGMMTGLGFLKLFGYYLQRRDERYAYIAKSMLMGAALSIDSKPDRRINRLHGPSTIYTVTCSVRSGIA